MLYSIKRFGTGYYSRNRHLIQTHQDVSGDYAFSFLEIIHGVGNERTDVHHSASSALPPSFPRFSLPTTTTLLAYQRIFQYRS